MLTYGMGRLGCSFVLELLAASSNDVAFLVAIPALSFPEPALLWTMVTCTPVTRLAA